MSEFCTCEVTPRINGVCVSCGKKREEKLTRQDLEDLQLALAIVLDRPVKAANRFSELWDKLDRLLIKYNQG